MAWHDATRECDTPAGVGCACDGTRIPTSRLDGNRTVGRIQLGTRSHATTQYGATITADHIWTARLG